MKYGICGHRVTQLVTYEWLGLDKELKISKHNGPLCSKCAKLFKAKRIDERN